jgi:acyl-coenzyme A synthetase/AMP-(fatty) acid ligase
MQASQAARRGPSSSVSLADYALFARLDEGLGEAVALRFGELAYRYAEVAARARALAAYLASAGVRQEERIYLVLPDAPPFAWAFFGALACGGVVVMGNPRATPEELAFVGEYARPSALITTPEVAAQLVSTVSSGPWARKLRTVLLVPEVATGRDPEAAMKVPQAVVDGPWEAIPLTDALARGGEGRDRPVVRGDDPAIWLLTSGSTGRPKAAVHAHRDLVAHSEAYALGTLGFHRGDVTISVPRLYFGYATGTNLIFPFAAGATVGLYAEAPTPERLARAHARYGATIVTNVPTMLARLLEHDDELAARGRRLELGGARFHICAGEALPPALLERFTSRFSVPVYDGIGSAETFHIYATNRPGDVRPGSLGRAVDGYELAILPQDAKGPGAPALPPGEVGVLWVRGPSVAMGYAGDREASNATFYGSWCRTGDLGRLDDAGYLYHDGRADSLFKVSGVWVAPAEVEACLMSHEAVAEVAVIPFRKDGLLKPEAHVVVSLRARERLLSEPGRIALAEELKAHVRTALGPQKHPRQIRFVEALPRSDRDKLDRGSLLAPGGEGTP